MSVYKFAGAVSARSEALLKPTAAPRSAGCANRSTHRERDLRRSPRRARDSSTEFIDAWFPRGIRPRQLSYVGQVQAAELRLILPGTHASGSRCATDRAALAVRWPLSNPPTSSEQPLARHPLASHQLRAYERPEKLDRTPPIRRNGPCLRCVGSCERRMTARDGARRWVPRVGARRWRV